MRESSPLLTEADTCRELVTPAIRLAGWGQAPYAIGEQHQITDGRILLIGGKARRAKQRRADYLLYYRRDFPIAVVEAKEAGLPAENGVQQAREYAQLLGLRFAYATNGRRIIEIDYTTGTEREVDRYATPEELWARLNGANGLPAAAQAQWLEPYNLTSGKIPRYYQDAAIRSVVEAILSGQKRVLATLATGTGKTSVAFQVCWKLWNSRWNRSGEYRRPKILFLADRNILVDDPKDKDFIHFGDARHKITGADPSQARDMYFGIYQALTTSSEDVFRQYAPDFFDLIVIDECHRGSARDSSSWRKVLDYFSAATHFGMTATPLREESRDSYEYFGNPVYTYSLRQGIEDGFLAPYRVHRVITTVDAAGWRPNRDELDRYGREIPDEEYQTKDFERVVALRARTQAMAKHLSDFMRGTDRFAKTIVFCENIDHAERMRQALVNANADLAAANKRYVMRITGDNDEGKAQLDNFIDPESTFPVIATTSQLMSTGVDAQTCHLIVLDKRINSMTEFKQIIGRGTRINEDYNKFFFTIMDFKRATALFADPAFDGEPVQIYEPGPGEPPVPPDEVPGTEDETGEVIYEPADPIEPPVTGEPPRKYYVDDVEVRVATERVQYLDEQGKLITESLKDYTRNTVRKAYASLKAFLNAWNDADRKQAIIDELATHGVFLDELAEQVGRDYDAFDLVCHVAFDQPPLTRRERAAQVKKRHVFAKYGDRTRAVLDALLEKYADGGIKSVESLDILKVDPLTAFGTPVEIVKLFGGKQSYLAAIRELETELYWKAA